MTLELTDRPVKPAGLDMPVESAALSHIALLGNFPPRRCGIATFTADVHAALSLQYPELVVDVFAMDDGAGPYAYPDAVAGTVAQDEPGAYRALARTLSESGAQLLWIQHEYGIFGGRAGEHLLELLDALDLPVALTLHTVLANPSADQRRVMNALVRRAALLFVMAERGRDILVKTYGASPAQIMVVPHGVHDRPAREPDAVKPAFGFDGRKVLMTFGLLSPGKGIETMIEALPAIVAARPDILYVVLGATHPHLLAREGEAYRDGLKARAEALGVAGHLRWVDSFLETGDLLDHLAAADIYVTPYLGAEQMTSGTLAYAVGLGVPVVSTPYVHAAELLAGGHGRLVGFGDSAGFAEAIIGLLNDPDELRRMRDANHRLGREMIWPRLADTSVAALAGALAGPGRRTPRTMAMPPLAAFAAIERLSDDTGILQHSRFGVPDRAHGYCVDDNARALLLMQRADDLSDALYARWTPVFASFVEHAWNEETKCFRNFMAFDRRWLEAAGSEDSSARTLWALGITAADGRGADLREWATCLFETALPHAPLQSPRAVAFAMLGAAAVFEARPGHSDARQALSTGGRRLASSLSKHGAPGSRWFEPGLAYDNARMPEALLRAGALLGRDDWLRDARAALDWLLGLQSASGRFRPVGTTGFGSLLADPAQYDQQPLEAWATIDACRTAFALDGDPRWREAAMQAWRWFEGENDGHAMLGDARTGECFDGLGPAGPNLNRGAESVLAFQLANRAIRSLAER